MQGVWVPSLVRDLRSHMPLRQKKSNNIKQEQYCNKFNKDFNNGPHKNILKKISRIFYYFLLNDFQL